MGRIVFYKNCDISEKNVQKIKDFVQKLYQKHKTEIDELREAQSIVSKSTLSTGDSYYDGSINYSLCSLLERIDDICAYNGAPRRFTELIKNIDLAIDKAKKVIAKAEKNNTYGIARLYNIWCENKYEYYETVKYTNYALDYITDDSIISFLASVLPVNE